jgi:hypothetical protein
LSVEINLDTSHLGGHLGNSLVEPTKEALQYLHHLVHVHDSTMTFADGQPQQDANPAEYFAPQRTARAWAGLSDYSV